MTQTSTEQPEALPTPEAVMEQAQVFASAWALYGSGSILEPENSAEVAATEKALLADMVRRLHARVQELEASQAQRVPLALHQRDTIKASAWRETMVGGYYDANAIIDATEAAHGITQEKHG